MNTKELIEKFFEEQFKNTSPFFLYKDKQLLKEGKFKEFAREQIKKTKMIFWAAAFSILLCAFWGSKSLIEYGAEPNLFDLILGLSAWIAIILGIVYAAKEYYTIKSSMELFIKLIDNREKESIA